MSSDRSWRDDAACLGMDPELFMAPRKAVPAVEGLRVCLQCPVRLNCLVEAVETIDPSGDDGVWGGTTVRQRQRIRTGRWTLEEAMEAGDQVAERSTTEELLERDEPWLIDAIPVGVREHHRPDAWGPS